jgi:hypothetical protein
MDGQLRPADFRAATIRDDFKKQISSQRDLARRARNKENGMSEVILAEMHINVTKAILPAFDHIKDEKYREVIAGCWARAAIDKMFNPTEAMLEAARVWSADYVEGPICNEAAIGCWRAMIRAALATTRPATPTNSPPAKPPKTTLPG